MVPAPIALFVYRRPDHTRLCLESLLTNPIAKESDLYVFSDGPKNPDAAEGVAQVRALFKDLGGFNQVTVVERETNLGLSRSIISGVTDVVRRHGRIIVVEDDLVASPYFLGYMNDALSMYQDQDRVASIHGYIYPVKRAVPETFFLRGADCWGWATWARAWAVFEPDGRKLLSRLRAGKLEKDFDREGTYPYMRMLEEQVSGKNDSWAVRWHASAFLADMLTLYPGRSLVQNIGHDALGTHCDLTRIFDVELTGKPMALSPSPLREDPQGSAAIQEYFRSLRPTVLRRMLSNLGSLVWKPKWSRT